MSSAIDETLNNAADEYRRKARRLRCRYASQPATLQLGLRLLAAEFRPPVQRDPLPPADPGQRFSQFLAQRRPAGGTVLRYSERLDLLRAARQLGVERFEANLLIASVFERGRRTIVEDKPAGNAGYMLPRVALFVAIQSAVLLGAWWAFLR